VRVYSRSAEKREAFAADMTATLGLHVTAADSPQSAI
jgi:ornithine cyclodeaminase/alanine dehydrogenase-like protein (mu-crystallin family)